MSCFDLADISIAADHGGCMGLPRFVRPLWAALLLLSGMISSLSAESVNGEVLKFMIADNLSELERMTKNYQERYREYPAEAKRNIDSVTIATKQANASLEKILRGEKLTKDDRLYRDYIMWFNTVEAWRGHTDPGALSQETHDALLKYYEQMLEFHEALLSEKSYSLERYRALKARWEAIKDEQ